jgi:release factor glutamine methyltransferase
MPNTNIKDLLSEATARLRAAGCDTPRLDAEVLLAFAMGKERIWLFAHDDELPPASAARNFQDYAGRRASREPLAYIIGRKEFYGRAFAVNPHVLIPRPETELLVEETVRLAMQRFPNDTFSIADIGTGSGCIAVSLAASLPSAHIYAVDASPEALRVAVQNAQRWQMNERISFLAGDGTAPLADRVDILVSNPPYLTTSEYKHTAPEIRLYEPSLALTAGEDGLAVIRPLLQSAPERLRPGGLLLMEIGARQGEAVLKIAALVFPVATRRLVKDLAGHERVLEIMTQE